MNLQFVAHEGHADRFGQYASKSEAYSDTGVLLTLVNVKTFEQDDMGRWAFSFTDGGEVEVPYGEMKRGYDHGV